ncbi:MAG: O-antigen ligase family protein [Anaerolineae bacterium]|nr:O-antigen ligase family protein [Anaerolineae bacterium]
MAVVFQALVVCVVGSLLGAASLYVPPVWLIALLGGMLVLLLAMGRAELFLLGLAVGLSTIFPFEEIPVVVSVGPGRVFLTDLIFGAPFVIMLLRWILDPEYKFNSTPLDLPVAVFFIVTLIATFVGLGRSLPNTITISEIIQSPPPIVTRIIPMIRLMAYYLLFYVVTNLVNNKKQLLLLLQGLAVLGTINAILMIVQFFFPSLQLLNFAGRVETLVTEGTSYQGVTRIVNITSEALVLIIFVVKISSLLIRKSWQPKVIDWVQFILLGGALIVTFKRSFWIGIIIAVLILVLIVHWAGKFRLLLYGVVGLVVFGLVVAGVRTQPDSDAYEYFSATADRLTSVFEEESYESGSSFDFRVVEANYARQQIAEHPLLGIGFGQYYRPWTNLLDWELQDLRGYIHSGHLYILTKTGFLGYFAFVWVSVLFIVRGFVYWKRITDERMSAIVIGFVLSYVVALIVATVSVVFLESYWVPLIAIMFGSNEVIYQLYIPPPEETAESDVLSVD